MHSVLEQQKRIAPGLQRVCGEPPLKVGNVCQVHSANDDVQPTIFVQITGCHQIPLMAGGNGKCIRSKVIPTGVLEEHDASLGMPFGISKIAGCQNIEIAVLVEISSLCTGRPVDREKEPFVKVVPPIVLQDPDPMVRL